MRDPVPSQDGPNGAVSSRRACLAIALALFALYVVGLVRTAWFSDDGFISVRTAENTVAGHGMRWNVADRTQTFTPPAWQLLITLTRACTGESYYSILALSMLLAVASVVLVVRTGGVVGRPATVVVLAAIASSRAFVEYSTSGLENPLGYALAAGFACVWFRADTGRPRRRIVLLACLGGALALTRFDLALLVAPALVAASRSVRLRVAIGAGVLAIGPVALWMAFSWIYYGSPFPLTAFAKAFSPGVPADTLAAEALRYVGNLLRWDPVTAAVLVAGLVVACTSRQRLPLGLGLALYAIYLARIGGDFMSGRFFAVPFALAACVLVRAEFSRRGALVASVVVLGLSSFSWIAFDRTPPWASPSDYGADYVPTAPPRRISDEREVYYARFGLLSPTRRLQEPGQLSNDLVRDGSIRLPVFMIEGQVGYSGFVGGEHLHIVDYWLCDPLLARLPMSRGAAWKVGHYPRRIPEGWFETVATGVDHVRHEGLQPLVDDLLLVLRGPELFSSARLAAITRLSTGHHRAGVARFVAEEYDNPPMLEMRTEVRGTRAEDGTPWWDPSMQVVYAGGVSLPLEPDSALRGADRLTVPLDAADSYRFVFLRGGTEVAAVSVVSAPRPFTGSQQFPFDVPAAAKRDGFDEIRILAGDSFDRIHAVGGIEVATK